MGNPARLEDIVDAMESQTEETHWYFDRQTGGDDQRG